MRLTPVAAVVVDACLFLLLSPASAMGQRWLVEFKPDPRCAATVNLSTPTSPNSPGVLVVIPIDMATRMPVRYSWVLAHDPLDSALAHPFASSRQPDSLGRHRFEELPGGLLAVSVRSIAYRQTRTAVVSRLGAADTLIIPLRALSEDTIRCEPPRFRRDGESACVTDFDTAEPHLELAREIATDSSMVPGLGRFKPNQIRVVREERICERAGKAYARGEGPMRRVLVIQLGSAGYLVLDPFEPHTAGEFELSYVFDRRWRFLMGFAG